MTAIGTTSKRVAERFGFEYSTSDVCDIFTNSSATTVIVGTRHDPHFPLTDAALNKNKHVRVEKLTCPAELTSRSTRRERQEFSVSFGSAKFIGTGTRGGASPSARTKGQAAMVRAFIDVVKRGGEPLIPFEHLIAVAAASFGAMESLRQRRSISVSAAEVLRPTDE